MLHHRLRAASGARESGGGGVPMDYIARWDMNNDSTDETGNYNITLYGDATQNTDSISYAVFCLYGQCSRLAFNDNEFTIILKFKAGSIDQSTGLWVACSRSNNTGIGYEWQILIYPPVSGNSILLSIKNSIGAEFLTTGPTITPGTVYTFAFRFTGEYVEIYDDTGALVAKTACTGTMNTGSLHTQFAKRGWEDASASFGEMDQYRGVAYDYALNGAELTSAIDKIKNGW